VGGKILIIEDNEDHRKLMEKVFSEAGCGDVQFARDGEEGIQRGEKERPDLIILDTRLPEMDGFEACKRLRGIKNLNAKIIMTTGYVDAVDAGRARAAGADDYVVKTSDFSQLRDAVKRYLG